jgi:LytS/YehU family sensor histidine kinase
MDIRIDTEGGAGTLDIAPLLLIPFVENAFKHGASNAISKGFVYIHILISNGELNFYVENSKPETPPARDPLRKSGGIGLTNVRRRLELLYPQQYNLEITEKPDAYAVNLWLKLVAY